MRAKPSGGLCASLDAWTEPQRQRLAAHAGELGSSPPASVHPGRSSRLRVRVRPVVLFDGPHRLAGTSVASLVLGKPHVLRRAEALSHAALNCSSGARGYRAPTLGSVEA